MSVTINKHQRSGLTRLARILDGTFGVFECGLGKTKEPQGQ